jgi:putative GTP pyrophosphokinase
MTKELSKTQVDRLGDRLKRRNITEEDLRLLDQYRRSFSEAYETVVGIIRDKLRLEPTGRPAKSTTSIADKLKRESIRLTQIQDIAGCRIIVADIAEQEFVVHSLTDLFPQATVIDRREKPSHGYRAVHVVVNQSGKLIEIQVRTSLQQVWAEMSEKLSDLVDASIKYGGGHEVLRTFLQVHSELVAMQEKGEMQLERVLTLAASEEDISDDVRQQIAVIQEGLEKNRREIFEQCREFINRVAKLKGDSK